MRIALTASLIALLAGFGTPAPAQDMIGLTPAQVGQIFCIGRLGNDMAPVAGIVTADLALAIGEAELKNTAYEAAHPGDKPPLGDGIPWQTAPDYADQCAVGDVTLKQDEADVKIDYGFAGYPEASFTDTLHLRMVQIDQYGTKGWRIDDVGYADDVKLRTVLVSIFIEN